MNAVHVGNMRERPHETNSAHVRAALAREVR